MAEWRMDGTDFRDITGVLSTNKQDTVGSTIVVLFLFNIEGGYNWCNNSIAFYLFFFETENL